MEMLWQKILWFEDALGCPIFNTTLRFLLYNCQFLGLQGMKLAEVKDLYLVEVYLWKKIAVISLENALCIQPNLCIQPSLCHIGAQLKYFPGPTQVGVYCSFNQLLEFGFYHADPHPGNLLRTDDGKLAYIGTISNARYMNWHITGSSYTNLVVSISSLLYHWAYL